MRQTAGGGCGCAEYHRGFRQAPARDNWILTPHPGEAGRLLGIETAEVQADRLAALAALIREYGGTIALKGAGTLVGARGKAPGLCERGNPGMASAGMGDVLTGAIAGILAQCRGPLAGNACGGHGPCVGGRCGCASRRAWPAGQRRRPGAAGLRQSLIAATPEATEAIGARLARALPAERSRMLQLQLHGDLGAGKTTLARGFLHALGSCRRGAQPDLHAVRVL